MPIHEIQTCIFESRFVALSSGPMRFVVGEVLQTIVFQIALSMAVEKGR